MSPVLWILCVLATPQAASKAEPAKTAAAEPRRVVRTDREWRTKLTREEYAVCRLKATETAFTGKYWNHHEDGMYRCVACENPLFVSNAKFDSGTGWPSFFQTIDRTKIKTALDNSTGEPRIEVECARCGSHLGHVFNDGPAPTGLRYCINSVSLKFEGVDEKREKTPAVETPKETAAAPPPGEKRLEFK